MGKGWKGKGEWRLEKWRKESENRGMEWKQRYTKLKERG